MTVTGITDTRVSYSGGLLDAFSLIMSWIQCNGGQTSGSVNFALDSVNCVNLPPSQARKKPRHCERSEAIQSGWA